MLSCQLLHLWRQQSTFDSEAMVCRLVSGSLASWLQPLSAAAAAALLTWPTLALHTLPINTSLTAAGSIPERSRAAAGHEQ
jgi:hypothetical protein